MDWHEVGVEVGLVVLFGLAMAGMFAITHLATTRWQAEEPSDEEVVASDMEQVAEDLRNVMPGEV